MYVINRRVSQKLRDGRPSNLAALARAGPRRGRKRVPRTTPGLTSEGLLKVKLSAATLQRLWKLIIVMTIVSKIN